MAKITALRLVLWVCQRESHGRCINNAACHILAGEHTACFKSCAGFHDARGILEPTSRTFANSVFTTHSSPHKHGITSWDWVSEPNNLPVFPAHTNQARNLEQRIW